MCEVFVRLEVIGRMEWPMTQAEIGDALGLSLVPVNRTWQELRADRLITLKDGTLVIHDWEALKEAGQFEPRYLHLSVRDPVQLRGNSGRTARAGFQGPAKPADY